MNGQEPLAFEKLICYEWAKGKEEGGGEEAVALMVYPRIYVVSLASLQEHRELPA